MSMNASMNASSIFALGFATFLTSLAGCGDAVLQPGAANGGNPGTYTDASANGHDGAAIDARALLADGATPPPGDDDSGVDAGTNPPPPPPTGALVAYASGYGPNISVFSVDGNG